MSKVAMNYLIAKLGRRGITAEEVTNIYHHDEPFLQITELTEEEDRRVMAGLLGLEVEELLPSYIRINFAVMLSLIARFMVDEVTWERKRRQADQRD